MNHLFSFRRCPYAMRARMALFYAGIPCRITEVDLKDKPESLLEISPKGTVPVLQLIDGQVIEESLDIMLWALDQNDPEGWQSSDLTLIHECDRDFKGWLDRYKYPNRFPNEDCSDARDCGADFLKKLDYHLARTGFLKGDRLGICDIAIFPFIRQFSHTDKDWFDTVPYPALRSWLTDRIESDLFKQIMQKNLKLLS